MRRIIFLIFLIFFTLFVYSQDKPKNAYLKYDYQLVVDNDVFTLGQTTDRYYSSGIFGTFRVLLDSGENQSKRIRSYQLNHRIYTPRFIKRRNVERLDRPYAGVLSATIANEYYLESNTYIKASIELGILGPASMVGETQVTWHGWFNMPTPAGWQYQIENTPLVNLHLNVVKPLYSSYRFELSSISEGSAGTVYNNVRQELMARMGRLRPMYQSAYTSSSLGRKRTNKISPRASEFYFFYAQGLEYVFQNATLQGSLFSDNSPHEVDVVHWVRQHRAGLMWSWERFDFGIIAYWRSQENIEAENHHYAGLRLNQRF